MSQQSNQLSGAEAFVRMLQGHGVRHIFGLCGDTTLPLYDALYRLDHGMKHILTRDERSAAYMADVYARVTGKVGVCEGPSGGGATYILPGVVEANESSIPILAVTTDISVGARGHYALTELDQAAMFRPLTKWNTVLDRAEDIPDAIRTAFRQMTTGRPGAAHIGLPFDVQRGTVDAESVHGDETYGHFPAHPAGPNPDDVVKAANAILSAEAPMFICGGGPVIAGAEAELAALAEALEAPVATTISGQGAISEEHPLGLGVVGSNGGTMPTRAMVDAADLVVFVGCRAGSVTTERWRHPATGVRVVHVDSDPGVIGANYETEAAIVADARLALAALGAEIAGRLSETPKRDRGRAAVAAAKAEKYAAFDALATSDDTPIRPERLIATLQELLPDDAVIVADPGTPCPYFSGYYKIRETGRHFISNRAHGALGYSLSGVLGAHIGRPQAKCVAVMGDGSFGFTAGEMETLVRMGAPVTLVVISNGVFGWIKAGQRAGFDERYFSVDFSVTDHAKVAEAYGVKAWRVAEPAELKPALSAALEAGGPTLVDVLCQPLHEANAPVSEWIS
ncbi:MAG: thiamine pyrophosphate-binding protein [Alphaproteobacteria bacterium]|jgi:acetolactate synthase-1/2/3 large subunit|nr:thiamine pyrophosphate-binding protein [Alphaproteobacteria bacterium]